MTYHTKKEILNQQMVWLAKDSEKSEGHDLVELTYAMAELNKELKPRLLSLSVAAILFNFLICFLVYVIKLFRCKA